ncbi:hypothetical protein JX266_012765 [Neoarthrinium moseri]|uniref:uncharacterized protein n=1 Tax=Neoarthrinium moseri TaxID=1658444 RepID=UPI001FDDC2E9|nr:uncharacterized protein JN550_010212 [Neoarthrinium moseri]KAI1841046.1 hypothetical protein JX266_012765 [Neoarthrinium moseri]KAI1862350.1 hypothetical protein JN550_010212 [Neoarthrinium moseri]
MAPSIQDEPPQGESRAPALIAVLTLGCVFANAIFFMRMYARAVLLRAFGRDDAVMAFCIFLVVALSITMGIEVQYGLGQHQSAYTDDYYVPYMKVSDEPSSFPYAAYP